MNEIEIQSKCWKEGNYYIIETNGIRYPKTLNETTVPKFTTAKFKCRIKSTNNISIRLHNLFQKDGKPLEIHESESGLDVYADLSIIENSNLIFEKCGSKDFFVLHLDNIGVGENYRRCYLGTVMFYIILKYVVDLCYKEFQIPNISKDVYISGRLSSAQKQFWDTSIPFYINLNKSLLYESLGYSSMKTCIYYMKQDSCGTKHICCYDSDNQTTFELPEELEKIKSLIQEDGYVSYHFRK